MKGGVNMSEPKKKSGARRSPPARTPEARENQLINMAFDLAEKQLKDGTASAAVISGFLKLGSSREKLEQERIRNELELNEQKMEALKAQAALQSVYTEALEAMRAYSGNSSSTVVVNPDDDFGD
jgi:hypothetical protein